jgi:hypothetical protein
VKLSVDEKKVAPLLPTLPRREALKLMAGMAGAAVSLPILGQPRYLSGQHASHAAHARTSGASALVYKPKFFSEPQMRAVEALAETIIPEDEHSPGAKAARVAEYIDAILGEADEEAVKLWRAGLSAVDRGAQARYGKVFAGCSPEQQVELLTEFSRNEDNPAALEERFFVALKNATINGYYTSEIGIHKDLEYQGNDALAEFEGCTHDGHKKGS